MSTITLDQSLASQLAACKDLTVLRDPHGAVLGTFDPTPLRIYEEGEIPEFDEEELNRRAKRRQGIPSEVVRQVLESLR